MNRTNGRAAAILATALIAFATNAASQEREQQDEQAWSVSLGAGAIYLPDYEGSDDYRVNGLPMLGINYRDVISLRGPSLMVDLFELSGSELAQDLGFGVLTRFDLGREADDNPILRNLVEIDQGALAGVFVSYQLGPVDLELTAMQDATSRYEGTIAQLQAGYAVTFTQRLLARLEISTRWSDDEYTQAYFGITGQEAAASGLREFEAAGGIKDVEAAAFLHYLVTEHWRVSGRLAYRRLLGDAADSPLVEDEGSANQASVALFVSYQF
jgi:outer membrane scaffolding protein for murein synthesis (MipA/OmpV family)